MNKQAGLWIDHRKAILVLIDGDNEVIKQIDSGMEKDVRYSGRAAAEEGSADNQRDRQFAAHLDKYYDEVIAHLRDAGSILLFGPGEAKGEFRKRLTKSGADDRLDSVETADKMTDGQIAAKVRKHFKK